MSKVYEIVRYMAKEGIEDNQLIEASKKLHGILEGLPGLISRKLSKSEAGEWIDIVLWDSIDDAVKTAEIVNTSPIAGDFMILVEESSITFTHYQLIDDYK